MKKTRLGKTGLYVSRVAFGALPIQRVDMEYAKKLLIKAYDSGINFFDTARGYSDSEEKIGNALSDFRKDIIIATKTPAKDKSSFFKDLEKSLRELKTDYIDLYQFHNPPFMPDKEDDNELLDAAFLAKKKGMIRYIGISSHKLDIARKAMLSSYFDTIQFPFSMLSTVEEADFVGECKKNDVGFIAMKALSGGLITDAKAAFAGLWKFDNVVPIWGIQKENELDMFIELEKDPPVIDDKMQKIIDDYRNELAGEFCRGCGYCMPCPADIPINMAARISLLLRRSISEDFLNESFKTKMLKINDCINCGHCKDNCPYGIDTPMLLKKELDKYMRAYDTKD